MLTDKQARFVEEYMRDLNATQAYIRAGYAPKGADTHGPRLLRNKEVLEAVKQKQAEMAAVSGWNLYRIVKAYEEIIDNPETKTRDVLMALDRLTKLLGLDRQRVQVEDVTTGIIEIPMADAGCT